MAPSYPGLYADLLFLMDGATSYSTWADTAKYVLEHPKVEKLEASRPDAQNFLEVEHYRLSRWVFMSVSYHALVVENTRTDKTRCLITSKYVGTPRMLIGARREAIGWVFEVICSNDPGITQGSFLDFPRRVA